MTSVPSRRFKRGWLETREYPVPADIPAALADLGLQVMRIIGDEANGKCPKHFERTGKEDRHPSWSCNTNTGVFNCFSCMYTGPFVQLVVDVLDISWDEAVEWVRQRGGIERVNKILGRGKYIDELLEEQAVQIFTEADLALYTTPPLEARRKRGLTEASCKYYGILWDKSRDMWITPIRDRNGKLLGWQEKNERVFKNRPFSIEKSKTLFGFHQFEGGTAILLESPLDCARLHSVGVKGAVSSYGAAVSDWQMQLLFEYADLIILALDNDRDGWKAAQQLKQRYRGMGRRLAFYNYGASDAKDAGDQSGDEIRFGVDHRLSPLRVRFSE
ncbi:toprim domain-containing protein [Streptomyces sp. NPDC088252]|uniref:toprim domain-containing protein n=1 Tax=Streptomyces sp. NPDC088252 TaxID=3365845 RepID=UPI003827C52C